MGKHEEFVDICKKIDVLTEYKSARATIEAVATLIQRREKAQNKLLGATIFAAYYGVLKIAHVGDKTFEVKFPQALFISTPNISVMGIKDEMLNFVVEHNHVE